MEIIVARHSGFCYGVKKSYTIVDEILKKHEDAAKSLSHNEDAAKSLAQHEDAAKSLAQNESALEPLSQDEAVVTHVHHGTKPVLNTFGDLIHNKQVVNMLKDRGATSVNSIDEINADTVVIRAHGISPKVWTKLKEKNVNLIDGTCQFVKNIHKLVREYLDQGYDIIITGSKKHPEIIGIVGNDEDRCHVIETVEEANELPPSDKKILIVSQTTFHVKKFEEISEILLQKFKNSKVRNTICGATHVNQDECETLSKQVDCVIVIGGRHSSNTVKLYEIARKNCQNSIHIESLEEIVVENLQKYDKIGIVAGASTPNWVIDAVIKKLKYK